MPNEGMSFLDTSGARTGHHDGEITNAAQLPAVAAQKTNGADSNRAGRLGGTNDIARIPGRGDREQAVAAPPEPENLPCENLIKRKVIGNARERRAVGRQCEGRQRLSLFDESP